MLVGLARTVSTVGLAAIGGVHALWASGSSWPEKNRKKLGKAVVGSSKGLPEDGAVTAIAVGATAGSAVAAGAFGEGRCVVALRRLMGAAFLARAVLGGERTLEVLDLPKGGKRFRDLDERYYRRLSAVLGVALLVGAKRCPRDDD